MKLKTKLPKKSGLWLIWGKENVSYWEWVQEEFSGGS